MQRKKTTRPSLSRTLGEKNRIHPDISNMTTQQPRVFFLPKFYFRGGKFSGSRVPKRILPKSRPRPTVVPSSCIPHHLHPTETILGRCRFWLVFGTYFLTLVGVYLESPYHGPNALGATSKPPNRAKKGSKRVKKGRSHFGSRRPSGCLGRNPIPFKDRLYLFPRFAKNLPSPIPAAGFGASVTELFDASEATEESLKFARGMTGLRHPQVLLSKTLGNGSTDPTRAGPSGKVVQNTFGRFLSKAGPKRVKKGRQKEPKSRAPLHHATAPKTPTRVKK